MIPSLLEASFFVENALSDLSFSQHDSHAANADRRRRENQRANQRLKLKRNYIFILLKPFKKEYLSNLFTFHRLFADILFQKRDKNRATLSHIVFVCTKA